MILDKLTYNKEKNTPIDKPICTESYIIINDEKIRVLHDKHELKEFVEFMSKFEIQNWLEIGVYHGGGIYVWKDLVSCDGLIVGIDKKVMPVDIKNLIKPTQTGKFVRVDLNIRNVPKKIKEISETYDVVFIDSSHKYEDVKRDFEKFSELAKKFIIIHDIYRYDDGAGRYWNEIKNNYDYIELPKNDKIIGYGIIKL